MSYDIINGKSNDMQCVTGEHYRITVLASRMLRLEYCESNIFEDLRLYGFDLTNGSQTVLNISMVRFSLILRAFSHFLLSVVLFLNHGNR